MNQARHNLEAAAEIEQSTGWLKARYIACSVEVGEHGGDRRSDQDVSDILKLTLNDAANVLRMGTRTIKAYLSVWDHAAFDGQCQSSGWLTPADGDTATTPADDLWPKYWETDDDKDNSSEPTETTAFDKALKGLQAFEKNALDQSVGIEGTEKLLRELNNAGLMVGGFSWKA